MSGTAICYMYRKLLNFDLSSIPAFLKLVTSTSRGTQAAFQGHREFVISTFPMENCVIAQNMLVHMADIKETIVRLGLCYKRITIKLCIFPLFSPSGLRHLSNRFRGTKHKWA
jgi:hypothetical protein